MTIDWAKLHASMPTGRTPEEKQKRKQLFSLFDPNNNGYLSLAEIDKGCRDVLNLYEIFDCKPVIMRAYQAAKNAHHSKGKAKSVAEDFVEFTEFRLLLVYLRQYFELWQMFSTIDTSGDRRIEKAEFNKALPLIQSWGVKIADPDAAFKEIDANGGGVILFDEFAHWALLKQLDLPDDDDADDEGLERLRK